MNLDEMIAVLEAAKAGKRIEYHRIGAKGWGECPLQAITWNFASWEYRVKPEPREFWISRRGTIHGLVWDVVAQPTGASGEIHVREVLDEGGAQ